MILSEIPQMPPNWREYSRFSNLPTRRSRPSACPVGVIRDRVGQGRRWYLSASLRKRPKYCSAKNERNCQSWVPSVRFQPLARHRSLDKIAILGGGPAQQEHPIGGVEGDVELLGPVGLLHHGQIVFQVDHERI